MVQSRFEKYGRFAAIHKVGEHFYDGVLENSYLLSRWRGELSLVC